MFIDVNTYVGHWPFRRLVNNTLSELSALAEKNDITHMVVANLNGLFYKDVNDANRELLAELSAYKGKTKFIPLAMVNPTYPEWERDARRAIEQGFCGFEIAPLYHNYSFAPQAVYDRLNSVHVAGQVMKLARELDVPVRICASFENFRARSDNDIPQNVTGEDIYNLIKDYPEVSVLVTSMHPGAAGEELSNLLAERDNIFFDINYMVTIATPTCRALANKVKDTTLCFGSLAPFQYIETNLVTITYSDFFDEEKIKANGARIFKNL